MQCEIDLLATHVQFASIMESECSRQEGTRKMRTPEERRLLILNL